MHRYIYILGWFWLVPGFGAKKTKNRPKSGFPKIPQVRGNASISVKTTNISEGPAQRARRSHLQLIFGRKSDFSTSAWVAYDFSAESCPKIVRDCKGIAPRLTNTEILGRAMAFPYTCGAAPRPGGRAGAMASDRARSGGSGAGRGAAQLAQSRTPARRCRPGVQPGRLGTEAKY